MAVLLLSVTAVSTAGSNSTSSNKNAPTVSILNEGYCYFSKNKLFDSLAKSKSNSGLLFGRFELVQKSWCDRQGGILFHPDDCRKKLGHVCIEAKDNDNIMMVIKVYGMKRKGEKREEKEVIEAVQQALIELELYQGLADGVAGPATKAAINQWLKNEGKSSISFDTFGGVIPDHLVDDITAAAQAEKARQAELARIEAEKKAEAEAKRKRIVELAKMKSTLERTASEKKELLAANKELSAVVASVTADRDRLSTEQKVWIKAIQTLQVQHDGLVSDKAKLLSEKSDLEAALSKLESEHQSLQSKHDGLVSDKA